MALSYSQLESGVVLAQEGEDYAAISRALKRHDQHLTLGGAVDPRFGKMLWRVYYDPGPERPNELVAVWRDPDGTPRDLSSGLVDQVMARDRNSREHMPTADELNVAWEKERQKRKEDGLLAIQEDTQFLHGRPIQPRSVRLRMQRDKQRARGEKV